MSNFLVNLARRGAGLAAIQVNAPPSAPFGAEMREQGDGLAEAIESTDSNHIATDPIVGNIADQSPSQSPSTVGLSRLVPDQTPIVQRQAESQLAPPTGGKPEGSTRRAYLENESTPHENHDVHPFDPGIHDADSAGRRQTTPPLEHGPALRIEVPAMRHAEAPHLEPTERLTREVSPHRSNLEAVADSDIGVRPTIAPPVGQVTEPVNVNEGNASRVEEDVLVNLNRNSVNAARSSTELSAEPMSSTARTLEPDPTVATIRPAASELDTQLPFPSAMPESSAASAPQPPIHVRIGRVEVRAAPAPPPKSTNSGPPSPFGFESYYRVRNYRC